jgi:hypothetical protein
MAQPLGSSLRAAHRSGLTSPDPVSSPHAATAPSPKTPAQDPDTPHNRQRQAKHA